MKQQSTILPVLAGIAVSIFFGLSFMFTKTALDVLTPFHLLGLRFTFAAITLTLLYLFKLVKIELKGKNLKPLFLIALFQPVGYFISETMGVNMTSSSEAGMIIALIPVFVVIIGALFLKEQPTFIQMIFIIMSVVGVVFIVLMGGKSGASGNTLGMIILLGAVISAAAYNVLSRKLSLHFNPFEITFVMMWVGAIAFNGTALIQAAQKGEIGSYFAPLANMNVLISIVFLGILSSVAAFLLLNYMLSKMEASTTAVYLNMTTVVSIIAGVIFRSEAFYWYHMVGAIMILAGVWGTNHFAVSGE